MRNRPHTPRPTPPRPQFRNELREHPVVSHLLGPVSNALCSRNENEQFGPFALPAEDGKLRLSIQDTIELALENNLDIAVARYNIAYSQTDLLRTQGGGTARGFTGRSNPRRCLPEPWAAVSAPPVPGQWGSRRGCRQHQRHAIGGRLL